MTLKAVTAPRDKTPLSAPDALARLRDVRARTEALAAPLSAEDMVVQSMPDVSPTKWHLGHTTWFFETFLLKAFDKTYSEFDPAFCYLFNSYYDAVGERHPRPKRGLLTRPALDRVMAYRAEVSDAIAGLLKAAEGGKDWADITRLLSLGCHHEEQHQELLLADIKHVLYQNPLRPAYAQKPADPVRKTQKLSWMAYPEGVREIGHGGRGFAFDSEGPRHKVYVGAFQLASRPVSNSEYLEFIEDGGYRRPEFWLSDAWAHICDEGKCQPLYWEKRDGEWREFLMQGEHPLNPGAPVCHLSYYEADAYARWAGARLPTEAELEVMAVATKATAGEVWEWTSSAYSPYPGFKPAAGAVGEYNGKFMVGQMVLRSGSGATPPGHWRPTYRNFFYPPSAWQFTGLRLAREP